MKHSHKKSFDWYSMQQRYSIRKYYFGAVSILLGTALVLGAAASVQTVQAEENKQETTNSISVGRGEAATKPAEVSASNKEKTYAAPTVANPVETTPVKTGEVTKPAEKVEEAKNKKEEVTHQDAIDKSKLLTALSRAKKLESKLYTEASAANLQTSIQAGQSLLGKEDASEAELSAAESSIQSSIIGLELRSNSNKGTVSETPVAKKANIVEAKEETNPAATTDRSAVDSAVLPTSTAAKVETTSAPASINEILKPGLSLSDARQNPAIRKEDVDRGYSGFRAAPAPTNQPVTNLGNNTVFTDISRGSHTFRGNGNSRRGNPIHFDVTTTRVRNRVDFSIRYSGPGEFVNNNFILDKGNGFGEPSRATVSTPKLRDQVKNISKGGNFVSHSGYSLEAAVETSTNQTIKFSLPIANPNGDLSVRLRPVTFNVGQGESGSATSNDPYSNSNYYFREKPLLLDANPNGGTNNKTVSEDIDFQTVYLPTSKLPEGQTRLVREGEKGQRQIIYKVHQLGNETILGLPISNSVIKEVKPRIMQIGVAKDLIDTVKPRVDQNKVGDTNNLTFYLDNDGNGVYTEGVDELVQKIAIKDGAKGEKGVQGERGLTGAQGQAGRDGVTPTVTVKDNKNDGTHTITINDGRGNVASTVVRDGFDGASPLVATQRNEADKTTTVIFYYDQNGNNQFDAGDTKLKEVVIADGKQGPKGDKGQDGFTPEVTVTDNNNGTHTITITQPDNKPSLTTIVKNGVDGQTPKVKAERDDAKKQTTLTFYIDKDGDGNYTAGKDELVQTTVVKDGQDGAAGASGRDGKEVLNGKVDPKENQGKDGDTFVNTQTGDVFVKKGNTWEPAGNIKGPKGERGEDGKTPEVTVTPGKDGHSTDITFTVPGKDPVTVNVKDGENGLNGKTPKVDLLRVQGKNGNPSHTIVTFYTDENNDGKYTPGTDELLGSEMIKDGAKGADGRDGKSLLTVKDGKETKVYQEDPANPGQPLNPEKPLAVIRDGVDGKSPTVTAVRKDEAGHKGVEITVDNHDGSQPTTVFVQDGAKGETGATGQDGQTPTITTQRGQDGQSTVVTITTSGKDPVTFTVKDGKNGKDGRAPKIKVEDITSPSRIRRDTDAAATPTRNGIRVTVYDDVNDNGVYDEGVDKVLNSKDIYNGIDGRDGSAPTITTKDNGDGTHTITVQNPDGSESTTVVKDGKDGKTANITTTENPDGSHTITVTNPDGSTKETVVKNGKDGKTPKVEVTDNNDGTHTVKVTDGDGNVTNAIIKDGKDGKAATATTTENPDGSHTVTITNPDGTKNEFVVKNGRDGVDGRTPTASVRDNGDGSHTIVITNPEGVTTETTVRDGKSPKVTITDEQNGTHKISVLNGDGTTTETIIKDGKSPVATVRDNQDGTYTIRVENGNGTVSETTVRDGKSPTAKVVDNGDGTHTITVVNSDGTTTTTTVRDGREPKLEVIDNNDGSHTIKVTGADGKGTTTTIFDGKSPKANIVDNGDGTHTLTIVDSDGREYKSIIKDGKDGKDSVSPTVTVKNNNDGTHVVTITNPDGSKTEMVIKDGKDGKSPKVSVEDNGDGSHTITIINSDGTVTKTVIKDGKDGRDGRDGRDGKDGKDGKCGCQDKPVTPSNDKPVPPTPNVPTPEVPVKPVPAQPTPNVPTPEVPVQPTPAVSTPEVPVKSVPAVPEQPVVPTPAQPATPVNANPVAPTTGKENRGDKLPETGSQSDYISVLLGSGILLSLYVGRRKED
ncbi:collagen-like surface-anchored protein [Streptococcus pneumoniae]|nr:collagen-like surface-anchored protein [Streptococcus pneumoniae]VLP38017.1 collagen-like surface-anchored protein [Streptococcus pneumoniae]VNK62179.1 collagen-like surface-anchored protein [Streptococcus pneumoniae]VNR57320.1 collagen-like surface-anchored protein [Streptococcus pneumoniae]VRO42305.1 collagen-like surface-anchored protein [Streptococcus pneumoniae]